MIVTFIGHSTLPAENDLFERIKTCLLEKIPENEKVLFFCGGYGEFDSLCAAVCRALKSSVPNAELVYVTPYLNQGKKMSYYLTEKLYDSVLYPPIESVPLKFAISKRNEWMVKKADLIISYVIYSCGGAAKTLAFAKKMGKDIVDLT